MECRLFVVFQSIERVRVSQIYVSVFPLQGFLLNLYVGEMFDFLRCNVTVM